MRALRPMLPIANEQSFQARPGFAQSSTVQDQLSLARHHVQQGDPTRAAQILGEITSPISEGSLGPGLQDQIHELREALSPTGSFDGTRVEVLASQFVDQVLDPAALTAMLGASTVYRLGRLGWLRVLQPGLGTLGTAQRFLASGLAFGMEAPSFVLFHNLGAGALGHRVDWSGQGFREQVRSSFMVLGGLKAFGFLGRQATSMLGVPAGFGAASIHQAAMYLGIVTGHAGENGLAGSSQTLGADMLLESLVTLIHFNGMGRMLGVLPGVMQGGVAVDGPSHPTIIRPRNFSTPAWATSTRSNGVSGGIRTRPQTRGPAILMMSGSGEGPRASRSGVLDTSTPLSQSLRENLQNLEELTTQEIFEDLLLSRCQTHLVAHHSYYIPESAYLEFIIERYPQITGEEVFADPILRRAIHETHGNITVASLQLPTRPHRLLSEAGVDNLSHLVLRIDRGDLQEIEGFGSGWEHLTREALKAFLGFNALASRLSTYESIRSELARPGVAGEIGRIREAALGELQAKRPRDGTTRQREWILNVAAASGGEFFRPSNEPEAKNILRILADYQNNVIRVEDSTFIMLETLAFHPGPSQGPRHWAMALLGLADLPIIPGVRGSIMARTSPLPPASPAAQRYMEAHQAGIEKLKTLPHLTPQLPEYTPVEREFGGVKVRVDVAQGVRRVKGLIRQMNREELDQLRQLARERSRQPWFIAGVSDGMGLATSAALMASGMMRHGVGVFYEPPALLKVGSPVHLARLANVEGLRVFAKQRGVQLSIHYTDMVLSRWGHSQGDREFPSNILESIEGASRASESPDLNFINSIAFARWISPAPGVPRLTQVPSVNIEGRVTLMDMKPYQEKPYQGTLDSMGRNHGALLSGLQNFFGPESQSYFFTWAGGSQNIRGLKGIYGRGALGEAKVIGEAAALRFHLQSQEQDFARGVHKVVRYPDFISFALFGIPGGGAFGLMARDILERRGFYQSVPQLAPRTFIEALTVNHLRNPLSQIEFDHAETTFMPGIVARMEEFNRRVEEYVGTHPEWNFRKPLDLETSARLLQGLVDPNYLEQLPKAGD